jgi:hypothetical protein
MKKMIVISDRLINKHAGEEYDAIVEVPFEPTTENIQPFADRIMADIKDLWGQQAPVQGEEDAQGDRKVVVYLDAAPAFAAMLTNLQIILKAEAGIVVELPWDKPIPVESLDRESQEVLKRLEKR